MIKKAEINIEQFDNGITARWSDVEGEVESQKTLAVKGDEARCIGRLVWGDLKEILSTNPTDNVTIKIQYVIPE